MSFGSFRTLTYAGLSLILTNIFIGLYLIVWLTHIKKVDSSQWTKYYPSLIPIATASFILGSLLLRFYYKSLFNFNKLCLFFIN